MDYQEKYEKALGWMRDVYPTLTGATKEDAEHYFPELAESEDERIRKAIIDEFQRRGQGSFAGYPMPDILAWLEKQKEQKPVDFPTTDKEVKEFLETHSEVEVPEKYKTPDFVFSKQEYESHPIISKDTTSVKPAEWSEEDEKMIKSILFVLESYVSKAECEQNPALTATYPTYYKEIDWLKSLHPSWKPTEEQMEALKECGECKRCIKELYEDLKKL